MGLLATVLKHVWDDVTADLYRLDILGQKDLLLAFLFMSGVYYALMGEVYCAKYHRSHGELLWQLYHVSGSECERWGGRSDVDIQMPLACYACLLSTTVYICNLISSTE